MSFYMVQEGWVLNKIPNGISSSLKWIFIHKFEDIRRHVASGRGEGGGKQGRPPLFIVANIFLKF